MSGLHIGVEQALGLFSIMLTVALVPGASVMAVAARTLKGGFKHGVVTTLGIIAGDTIFIVLALYGLVWLASELDQQFAIVELLAGLWLLVLGASLFRVSPAAIHHDNTADPALHTSFMLGLLITLGDQKAILFYLGLLPAVIDSSRISVLDTLVIILLAVVALSSKLVYAILVSRTGRLMQNTALLHTMHAIAACMLMAAGGYLLYSALPAFLPAA